MAVPPIHEFPALLAALIERRELSVAQVESVFEQALAGRLGESEMAAFLVAMRMKGETGGELAAAARVLRRRMTRLNVESNQLLDTCGTGGDDSGTFNISTAAAIVAAGAGASVVKHGNRAVSSRCGSADVLAELGVPIEAGVEWARDCLARAGLAFCFAPQFHPAMKHLGPLRKRLGVRTMVNLLGPLANPAGAAFQLLGVGRRELLEPVAEALAALGTRGAYVVCSDDGLDEVSLSAPTNFVQVTGESVCRSGRWLPEDFGLERCRMSDLAAADAVESARTTRSVLAGEAGPARRVVLANAAIALLATQTVSNVLDGVRRAAEAIDSGRAAAVLQRMMVNPTAS